MAGYPVKSSGLILMALDPIGGIEGFPVART
jgi:hypothetical protein